MIQAASAAPDPIALPTGQFITPTAAPGSVFQALNPHVASAPDYTVGQAVSTAVSPDGKTLLVLTSGFNLNADPVKRAVDPATSVEFVFVFDISTGTPNQLQAIPVPNTFSGIAWAPDGTAFYVAGGQDDNVHTYAKTGGLWAEKGTPIAFHHTALGNKQQPAGNGLFSLPGFGAAVGPLAAGLGVTADGHKLIVANLENDSISIIDLNSNNAVTELDLRPGRNDPTQSGVPGGEFPFWVAVKGSDTVYVSSERDREIVVVSLADVKPKVTARIPVKGNPNKMALNKAQTRLFVTTDNSDLLYIIDTRTNGIIASVKTTGPADLGKVVHTTGSSPNSVTLSPDERFAYVTNAGTNSVAVIDVARSRPVVVGLIPTGWYPSGVATSADGKMLYVVNTKSNAGPNPQEENQLTNQYIWQLTKAGFLTLPVPHGDALEDLTEIVAKNNGFDRSRGEPGEFHFARGHDDDERHERDAQTMEFLRNHIEHVIYIVKENRTYDQILGDLPVGNGDPTLTMYGKAVTPNFHAIATQFVDLDNFYCSGEVSMDGWQWSVSGRGIDLNEKVVVVNYGKGGGSYDSEGLSRDVNVALATTAARVAANPVYGIQAALDPDLLPGTANAVAADGPDGEEGAGYIWNAALRAGKSVRNYGFWEDLVRYEAPAQFGGIPPLRDPASTNTVVAFPTDPALLTLTDLFFRGFDNQLPDFYRYKEWAREFDQQVATHSFPAFETVRFMNDHTGAFSTAIDGVNTPELQQADNDYAVGLLIQKIANSPYAHNTLIFVLEDDAQDGPDHVDAHRSTGYVVGPYVKQGKVVSTRYATINMLRTIEDVLGLEHLSLHDAGVPPMTDVFDIRQGPNWSYTATPSALLLGTQLPIPKHASLEGVPVPRPLHEAAWWEEKTKGFTFAKEDLNDAAAYNRVLWEGTMTGPYPAARSGLDLRENRAELLKAAAIDTAPSKD
jgi:YVTN family beta-propeller protein